MVFKDIFNTSRDSSAYATTAQTTLSGYVPRKPNEDVSLPPHDPFEPLTVVQQDPKLVRETSPQADGMFKMIGALTGSVKNSSDNLETAINDPSSVVAPGDSVMGTAYKISRKVSDDVPAPAAKKPEAQTPQVQMPDTPTVPKPAK